MPRMTTGIGATLRDYRNRRGLSQKQLAALAKVGRTTIANIETDRQIPSLRALGALALALGVQAEDLIAGWKPAGGAR